MKSVLEKKLDDFKKTRRYDVIMYNIPIYRH